MVNSPQQTNVPEPEPLQIILPTSLSLTEGGEIEESSAVSGESGPMSVQPEAELSTKPTETDGKSTDAIVDSQNVDVNTTVSTENVVGGISSEKVLADKITENVAENVVVENVISESMHVNEIIEAVVSDLREDDDLGGDIPNSETVENPNVHNKGDDAENDDLIATHLLNLKKSGVIGGKRKKSLAARSPAKKKDVGCSSVSPSVTTDKKRRVLRKQGKPVKHVVVEDPTVPPVVETVEKNTDDEGVEIVGSTAGKRLTRSGVKELEKKKAILGVGEPVIVEKKAKKAKKLQEKRPAKSVLKGASASKKKRGLVDSDKEEEAGDIVEAAVSDSTEYDSAEGSNARGKLKMNENRSRINNRRISKDVEKVSTKGIWFYNEESRAMYKFVCSRKILAEKRLSELTLKNQTFMNVLEESGMLCLNGNQELYWPSIVREFLSNMSTEIGMAPSVNFHKVHIRKKIVEFSSEVINKHLGWNADGAVTGSELLLQDIVKTLTGGTVNSWPVKGQLPASKLSVKYAVMHKMALVNLMPTSNSTNVSEAVGKLLYVLGSEQNLDFGQIIFDQIIDHARTGAVLKPIGFPRLICSIVLDQYPEILKAEDGAGEAMKEFTISEKLLTGDHAVDIQVLPSVKPAVIPTGGVADVLITAYKEERKGLIANIQMMQNRVRELDQKISMLEVAETPTVNDPEVQQPAVAAGNAAGSSAVADVETVVPAAVATVGVAEPVVPDQVEETETAVSQGE